MIRYRRFGRSDRTVFFSDHGTKVSALDNALSHTEDTDLRVAIMKFLETLKPEQIISVTEGAAVVVYYRTLDYVPIRVKDQENAHGDNDS